MVYMSSIDLIIVFNTSNRVYTFIKINFKKDVLASLGAANGTTVAGISGSAGAFADQLSSPTTITLDQYGSMYIMDSGNNRVQQWTSGSTFGVTVIASTSFSSPRGMAFNPNGDLSIADYSNHRIVQFPVVCRTYLYINN